MSAAPMAPTVGASSICATDWIASNRSVEHRQSVVARLAARRLPAPGAQRLRLGLVQDVRWGWLSRVAVDFRQTTLPFRQRGDAHPQRPKHGIFLGSAQMRKIRQRFHGFGYPLACRLSKQNMCGGFAGPGYLPEIIICAPRYFAKNRDLSIVLSRIFKIRYGINP